MGNRLKGKEFKALEEAVVARLAYIDAALWQNMGEESNAKYRKERNTLESAWSKVVKEMQLA